MKLTVAAALLAIALVCGCKSPSPQPEATHPAPAEHERALTTSRSDPHSGTPGAFDYYLLNLSWSPEFCHGHPTSAECPLHKAFVLHGLWPENLDGSYPSNCSSAPGPTNPSSYADIYPDAGLLEHEWQTHGTCSGLSADAFFQAARSAFHSVAIPAALASLHAPTSMPPEQVLSLFNASNPTVPRTSLVLSCGNNYLTAVELCLDKSLHPAACGQVRSCRANSVRILPPG